MNSLFVFKNSLVLEKLHCCGIQSHLFTAGQRGKKIWMLFSAEYTFKLWMYVSVPTHQTSLPAQAVLLFPLLCNRESWKEPEMVCEVWVPLQQTPVNEPGRISGPFPLGILCLTLAVNHTPSWLMVTVPVFCRRTNTMALYWMMKQDRKPG